MARQLPPGVTDYQYQGTCSRCGRLTTFTTIVRYGATKTMKCPTCLAPMELALKEEQHGPRSTDRT